mgnify:FL=1
MMMMAGSPHSYQNQFLRSDLMLTMDQQYVAPDQSQVFYALQRDSTTLAAAAAANHAFSAKHVPNHAANYDINDSNCDQKKKKTKKINSAVKKRPPQRGLGVAQLEKLRRMDPTIAASISHTNHHQNANLVTQQRLESLNHRRPCVNSIAPCLNHDELKCSTNQMPSLYTDSAAHPGVINYTSANHKPSCLSTLMIANPALQKGLISTPNRQFDRVMGHNTCCQDHQSGKNSYRFNRTINLEQVLILSCHYSD